MPQNVITKILDRLKKEKVLKAENNQIFLIKSLDDIVSRFEKEKINLTEQSTKVITSLISFFQENGKNIDKNEAENLLIDFFSKQGINIFSDIEKLEMLGKKNNPMDYFIAQFILKQANDKTIIFEYLIEMIKGFFLSTVISIQPDNNNISKSKLRDVAFYFDTRIILNILGYHSVEIKNATEELLKMLKEQNSKVYCFEHNVAEIIDVLKQYRQSLSFPRTRKATLEGLYGYTESDVLRLIATIRSKIENIGISIIGIPDYICEESNKRVFLDETELKKYLKDNRPKVLENANEKDVQSVAGICRLRGQIYSNYIEKSKAIFITTSSTFAKLTSEYLKYLYAENFPALITDIDLSAIVWLKNYNTHKDYPKLKLIANAMFALEPSQSLLDNFFNKIDKLVTEGKIVKEEASILRIDTYLRKDLVSITHGDDTNVTDETVFTLRDKLKEKYTKDIMTSAELTMQTYMQEQHQVRLAKKRKLNEKMANLIKEAGEDIKQRVEKILRFIVWTAIIMILICFVITLVQGIIKDNPKWNIILFSGIFELIFFIDFFCSKFNFINKIIKTFGNKAMHIRKEIEREKLRILYDIDDDIKQ